MNSSDSAFQTIVNTVAGELSDLTDLAQATRIIFKLLLAALLGGMLGYEREASGKAAGLRTHMLVAMGSATFLAVAQLMGMTPMDSSRVIQGLVAGVGFLGAGAILKPAKESTEDVKGLTTAAGIWFTAAIGMAVGAGEEAAAILCALFALFVLMVLPKNVVPRKDGSPAEQRQPE